MHHVGVKTRECLGVPDPDRLVDSCSEAVRSVPLRAQLHSSDPVVVAEELAHKSFRFDVVESHLGVGEQG